jgi:hypothetical protein
LRDERFERIINEILVGVVKNKKDRIDILQLSQEFKKREDIDEFLVFKDKRAKILNKKFFDEFVFDFLNINSWDDFEKKNKK